MIETKGLLQNDNILWDGNDMKAMIQVMFLLKVSDTELDL